MQTINRRLFLRSAAIALVALQFVGTIPSASASPASDSTKGQVMMPASSSTAASGVPAQVALPTNPPVNGRPWLPEHSMVKVTSRRGRALI